MYILKYETYSKYLGFKRVHYKEFTTMLQIRNYIEENDLIHFEIYIRGIKWVMKKNINLL